MHFVLSMNRSMEISAEMISCNQERVPFDSGLPTTPTRMADSILQNRTPGALAGVHRMLQRPGEN